MRKTVIFTFFLSCLIFSNSDRLPLLITCACKNDNFPVDEGILEMSEATRM